jgi:flagellar protein FliO/FliZ
MVEIALRIFFSLAVVVLLMWGLAKVARRPLSGRNGGALSVLARQALSRGASVAVVRVGDRAYVVGVTDQTVTLLAEADPDAIEAAAHPSHEVREQLSLDALAGAGSLSGSGPLTGSALSPSTWRQAAAAVFKGRKT